MNQRTIAIGIAVLLLIIGIAFFMFYSKQNEEMVGGPCSYEIIKYPAKVLRIDTVSDNEFALSLSIEFGDFIDTINSYHIANRYYTFTETAGLNLSLESVITYEQHEIIEGACNPSIDKIVLEEFK